MGDGIHSFLYPGHMTASVVARHNPLDPGHTTVSVAAHLESWLGKVLA